MILKQWIVRLRPNFLATCSPNTAILDIQYPLENKDMQYPVFVDPRVCYSDSDSQQVISAMQSFPSGHTGSAFAVGVFLALYLNAKTKSFANYQTEFWKMMLVLAPLIGAVVIAAGLIIDKVNLIPFKTHCF